MPQSFESTEARERVLDGAEKLFAQRGYRAVTLRDIASSVGVHHTTLYYHIPGGKEQLFMEVIERNFRRHQQGLREAIAQAAPDLLASLYAIADWLLSQPPMDLVRLIYSDMPALDPVHTQRITEVAYSSMLAPIESALRSGYERGEIGQHDFAHVAGAVLGMVESIYAIPGPITTVARQEIAREILDILVAGLRKHESASQ
ncbi:TetR/AcrR family transcriptional regulator [Ktedonosporobacter rubrisoli]|uniref:TetR/AcrR family transcriptional regulator n=1 Tax=Ktedonosporobacter rubrisoli TaxID=2509675 RepID=A0A4P6JJJ5_KTERU|nr:TetR/AcrR family transcriptional regulator [Ktedonosporobacter rubrisoli]QBD75100.1 TetR/AcrR family transcriptional regulator [Ktedonosporobacter rubrisoli]